MGFLKVLHIYYMQNMHSWARLGVRAGQSTPPNPTRKNKNNRGTNTILKIELLKNINYT
jgi:hypothetical protein|tara:strand:+ start:820 stop:996 length:177 start_codon:yes stop_codon:yes gene_type:complete